VKKSGPSSQGAAGFFMERGRDNLTRIELRIDAPMKAQGFAGKEQHLFQEVFVVQDFVSF